MISRPSLASAAQGLGHRSQRPTDLAPGFPSTPLQYREQSIQEDQSAEGGAVELAHALVEWQLSPAWL